MSWKPLREAHRCHARGCETVVKPAYLMCWPHWRLVPRELKDAVWDAYVPGQERRKDPSREYLRAARAAIDHVASLERSAVTS